MSKFERNFIIGLVSYLLVAVVTFGHAAAHHPKCIETPQHNYCPGGDAEMAGMAAAFFWPFYWSWEIWS